MPSEPKTGAEIIVEALIQEKIPYIFGIPGHGCLGFTDALRKYQHAIKVIQPKQEMAGVHMAVGYYRVTGQPLAVFTSIGPGAINTAIGVADAYVDSMPVLVITGDTHVHMRGVGVLQEIERTRDSAFPQILEPVVKRSFEIVQADQIPKAMHRAFNLMLTGRRGPVHIDLPMDVQCDVCHSPPSVARLRRTEYVPRADPHAIEQTGKMLMNAKRPIIWLGGGVVTAKAFDEIKTLAEFLGSPVLASMMAKDAFPNDHPLFGWATGSKGTKCGLALSRSADVVLAVGTRFADESTCSYKKGEAWNFGELSTDTSLIQIDIDPHEIGKNYPVSLGILGDAKMVLADLITFLRSQYSPRDYKNSDYYREIQQLRTEWMQFLNQWRKPNITPVMISCVLREIRAFLNRDAIIVTSSGNVQAQMIQELEFYHPNTCITAGGFSTMGYTLPASIGAKLGQPNKQVVGLVGDGDFMMTMQELHTAKQLGINIVLVILNNAGWIAITDLQRAALGEDHSYATEFFDREGRVYAPDFRAIAQGFGCWAIQISRTEEIQPALAQAFRQEGPAVIEVIVNRNPAFSGSPAWGWWDVPIPAYLAERRAKYLAERQHEDLH